MIEKSGKRGRGGFFADVRPVCRPIDVAAIARRIVRHSVLTGGRAEVKQSAAGIQVRMPSAQRHAVDTIVKLELDDPAGSA